MKFALAFIGATLLVTLGINLLEASNLALYKILLGSASIGCAYLLLLEGFQ